MGVLPSYRGCGCGAKLISAIEDRLAGEGMEILTVNSKITAVKFYESLGFVTTGVSFDDNGVRRVPMGKNNVFRGCDMLAGRDIDAVTVRQDFHCGCVAKARLLVTAFGFVETTINGRPVSDEVLCPAMADYEKRDLTDVSYPITDSFSHSAYYLDYDVTGLLRNGKNTIGLHLGNGWYGPKRPRNEDMPRWGKIKCAFKLLLTYADGMTDVIRSNASCASAADSYVTRSRMHSGETIDLTMYRKGWDTPDYNGEGFEPARVLPAPATFYRRWLYTPERIAGSVTPKMISDLGQRKVYDLGHDEAGWPVVVFDGGNTDDTACLRCSEELAADGTLDFESCGGLNRIQRDIYYNCEGFEGMELHPHFLWHACRYIELTGCARVVRFDIVHTDLKVTASYTGSDETLRWIYDAYVRTELMNVHGCIPSDCPHRERLGYTGDGQLTCRAVMTIFDARDMYRKWMRDISDCQDIYSGHVQHTAPFYGGGGGPGGWGGAVVILPYSYYKYYGSDELIRTYYNNMRLYIDYMASRRTDGLVTREAPLGWCLGDWCMPGKGEKIPEPLVNTYFLIKCAEMVIESASLTGHESDIPALEALDKECREAFIKAYYDESTGSFCHDLNGANAFAFDLGMGDKRLLDNIVRKYDGLGEYDTGMFATDVLTRILFENGHADLAVKLLTSHGEVSFYNMKRHGATTIWENWNGESSHCHPMFAGIAEYVVRYCK